MCFFWLLVSNVLRQQSWALEQKPWAWNLKPVWMAEWSPGDAWRPAWRAKWSQSGAWRLVWSAEWSPSFTRKLSWASSTSGTSPTQRGRLGLHRRISAFAKRYGIPKWPFLLPGRARRNAEFLRELSLKGQVESNWRLRGQFEGPSGIPSNAWRPVWKAKWSQSGAWSPVWKATWSQSGQLDSIKNKIEISKIPKEVLIFEEKKEWRKAFF